MAVFGSFLRGAFGRPKPGRETIERVKAYARETLAAGPDTTFAVNEIVCADPACPGTETVILVMAPGARSRAYKVGKPLEAVTEQDIAAALVR